MSGYRMDRIRVTPGDAEPATPEICRQVNDEDETIKPPAASQQELNGHEAAFWNKPLNSDRNQRGADGGS